jgi:hypothetical protein
MLLKSGMMSLEAKDRNVYCGMEYCMASACIVSLGTSVAGS